MHDGKGGCHDRGEQVDGTKCTGAVWTYERFFVLKNKRVEKGTVKRDQRKI